MAERDFQAALLHVYRTAEVPAAVDLTSRERGWLEELIASQRDRLGFVADRLRAKRQRFIWHALPASRQAFPNVFEALLRDWSQAASLESGTDGAGPMRDFARSVAAQQRPCPERAAAFVQFDAACAAVALFTGPRDVPATWSPLLQLGLEEDADLIQCDYDLDALHDPAILAEAQRSPAPLNVLLFLQRSGGVGSVDLSPGLAAVLAQFRGGASARHILARLPSSAARDALSDTLVQLHRRGVPFFLPGQAEAP